MKSRFGLILVVVILFSQLAALAVVPSVKAQAALSPSALPSIALSGIPRQVAINTKTNTLYVAQSPADGTTNETLSIINGNTNSIVTIDIGTGFEAMAVNEATNQVYVSNGFGGLYVRDGQTGAIVDTIGMTRPKTIAVNPDNNRIYVLDNELLKVLDANTHTVISDPVSVGFASYISAINTKSMKLYAAYNDGTGVDRLRVFDITPVTPVEVSGPLGILPYNDGYLKGAVDTQNNIVYVANTDTNVIYVIDGSDNHIIDTITYPYGLDTATGKYQRSLPNDIAFDSTTNKLLVGTTNETFTPNSNPPDNVVYQTFEIRNANAATHDYSVTASLSDYLPTAGQFIPKQEFVFNTVTGRAYFIDHIVNGLTPRSVSVVQVREGTTATYSISGRVVSGSTTITDLSGITITAVSISRLITGSATTDRAGNYKISNLPADIYTLAPSTTNTTVRFLPNEQTVTISTADATAPDFTVYIPSTLTIDYFALGDSIASGHGLSDNGTACRQARTSAHPSYPFQIASKLEQRYGLGAVNFVVLPGDVFGRTSVDNFLACSGAIIGLPDPLLGLQQPTGSLYKQFNEQVTETVNRVKLLTNSHQILVSISIGANNFGWADYSTMVKLFDMSTVNLKSLVKSITGNVQTSLVADINKLLAAHPNVRIVVTQYHNPFNPKSVLWQAYPTRLTCRDKKGEMNCYDRTNLIVTELNKAIKKSVSLVGSSKRVVAISDDLYKNFLKHPSPGVTNGIPGPIRTCGFTGPSENDTWVESPSLEYANSNPPIPAPYNLILVDWKGDCFHPNDKGAQQYAYYVDLAAQKLSR